MTSRPNKFLILLAIIGAASCQFMSSSFTGFDYQPDESKRHETVDEQGNVHGHYNYVDQNGKTINVKYSAGKDGFKIVGEQMPTLPQQNYYQLPTTSRDYQSIYRKQPDSYSQYMRPKSPVAYNEDDLRGYQSQAVYQSQEYQPKFTQALFDPSDDPYPAASMGQLKSYKEALEEERMQMEMESLQPKAHVSVQNPNQGYSYNIKY